MTVTDDTKLGPITVSDEVAEALRAGGPVVALESSGIPHGFPYPDNRRVALDVEKAVRAAGAIPARVGILDGRLVVGMSERRGRAARRGPGCPQGQYP